MTDNKDYPPNLLTLIDTAEFPTSKTELIKVAENNNASEEAIEAFRALRHEEYETLEDVNNDLGLIEELPGQENLFASKSA